MGVDQRGTVTSASPASGVKGLISTPRYLNTHDMLHDAHSISQMPMFCGELTVLTVASASPAYALLRTLVPRAVVDGSGRGRRLATMARERTETHQQRAGRQGSRRGAFSARPRLFTP